MEEPNSALLPMLASTRKGTRPGGLGNNGNPVESAGGIIKINFIYTDFAGTSAWYKGSYPLCRRPPVCVQADLQRMERDRERQL